VGKDWQGQAAPVARERAGTSHLSKEQVDRTGGDGDVTELGKDDYRGATDG